MFVASGSQGVSVLVTGALRRLKRHELSAMRSRDSDLVILLLDQCMAQ